MAATSIRIATKQRLVDLIAAAAEDDTFVFYGRPGKDIPFEGVAVTDVTGTAAVRDMRYGRKARREEYTVTIQVWANAEGQESAAAAEDRCDVYVQLVENALADSPQLADGDGNGLDGLYSAVLAQSDGPNSNGDDKGWYANATLHVDCVAFLT